MLKDILSSLLVIATCTMSVRCASLQENPRPGSPEQAAKQAIKDIGEGYRSRVKVTLKDGTRLEGYLSTVADDYFSVTSEKTGKTSRVSYDAVAKIARQRPRRASNWRGIGAVFAAAGIIVFALVVYVISDRNG